MKRRRPGRTILIAPLLAALGTAVVPIGSAAAQTVTADTPAATVLVDAGVDVATSPLEAAVEPADGGDDGGPGVAPILGGLVVIGAVFAMGLAAIRRQRAEGRRSKLPPIG